MAAPASAPASLGRRAACDCNARTHSRTANQSMCAPLPNSSMVSGHHAHNATVHSGRSRARRRRKSSQATAIAPSAAASCSGRWLPLPPNEATRIAANAASRSEEHTSELQSHVNLVCRLLLEKKKKKNYHLLTDLKKHEKL